MWKLEEVVEGLSAIWNNEFKKSDKIFGAKKSESPRYALHYAESCFLKSFITADHADSAEALERLKTAHSLANTHLGYLEKGFDPLSPQTKIENTKELHNRVVDCRLVTGDTLFMISILQVTRNARIKGIFNLRKSWKVYEKTLKESKAMKELDPELHKCLLFGAGFFLFALSIVPSKFLKLIELVGFKADKDTGLDYLRDCQKQDGIREAFSTMLLLVNNLLLPRGLNNPEKCLIEADELIKGALKKYPGGSLFQLMGSHHARKLCLLDKAQDLMEAALQNCKKDDSGLTKTPLIYRYELANVMSMRALWKESSVIYSELIPEKEFQVRTLCAMQRAACLVMLGENDKAIAQLNELGTFPDKSSNLGPVLVRQSKRYIANGAHFLPFELLYMRRDLVKMTPVMDKIEAALEKTAEMLKANQKKALPEKKAQTTLAKISSGFGGLLNNITKKTPTDFSFDHRAAYLMIKASIVKVDHKHEKAIQMFQEVIDMGEFLQEKLYLPYCLYEMGESYYILGKLKEAEDCMKRCSKISGYDWEDPLRVRLRVTFDQLKKGIAPTTKVSLDDLLKGSDSKTESVMSEPSELDVDTEESEDRQAFKEDDDE